MAVKRRQYERRDIAEGRVLLLLAERGTASSTLIGRLFNWDERKVRYIMHGLSERGLVAILPVGMSMISSVNRTPEVGRALRKGEEFGYFLFGGSDIVLLFQDRKLVLEAEVGRKYLQGERIGIVE